MTAKRTCRRSPKSLAAVSSGGEIEGIRRRQLQLSYAELLLAVNGLAVPGLLAP